jgi:hypothetical protein
VDGVIPWVGVKGKVDEFQADMHQREEESTVPGPIPNTTRTIRRKPIYAAEVNLKGIDLRALLATFEEPLKRTVGMTAPPQRSNYRRHDNLPAVSSRSLWHDLDDFVELDWTPTNNPILHLLPAASCPHFTYFKQNSALSMNHPQTSKFGSEHSHSCLLGQEPCTLYYAGNFHILIRTSSCCPNPDIFGISKARRTQEENQFWINVRSTSFSPGGHILDI